MVGSQVSSLFHRCIASSQEFLFSYARSELFRSDVIRYPEIPLLVNPPTTRSLFIKFMSTLQTGPDHLSEKDTFSFKVRCANFLLIGHLFFFLKYFVFLLPLVLDAPSMQSFYQVVSHAKTIIFIQIY